MDIDVVLPPRPSWLPAPPDQLRAAVPRPPRLPRSTLVSVAIGAEFERKLEALRASAFSAGFDDVLLWREHQFLADPVLRTPLVGSPAGATFRDVFVGVLRHERFDPRAQKITKSIRPYCAAFKMVALWRALQQSEHGDYVMWADSSRYFANVTLAPGLLRRAVDLLRGAVPRPTRPSHVAARWRASSWYDGRLKTGDWASVAVGSAFGLLTCSGWDCETDLYTWNGLQQVISDRTRAAYSELIGASDLLQRPLVLNSNILLRNAPSTRLLVWDWLGMAVARPAGFCSSHVQDQVARARIHPQTSLPPAPFSPWLAPVPRAGRLHHPGAQPLAAAHQRVSLPRPALEAVVRAAKVRQAHQEQQRVPRAHRRRCV